MGLVAGLRGLSQSGLVHFGIFILEPGFMILLCFSFILHQRMSLSTGDFGLRTSKMRSFIRAYMAGCGPCWTQEQWALVPLSPEAQVVLFHILFLWILEADVEGLLSNR